MQQYLQKTLLKILVATVISKENMLATLNPIENYDSHNYDTLDAKTIVFVFMQKARVAASYHRSKNMVAVAVFIKYLKQPQRFLKKLLVPITIFRQNYGNHNGFQKKSMAAVAISIANCGSHMGFDINLTYFFKNS